MNSKANQATIFSMLQFLFKKMKKKKLLIIFSFILLLGISFLEFKIPQMTQQIIDVSIPEKSFQGIIYHVSILLGLAFILSLLSYLSTMSMSRVSQDVIIDLRVDLYQQILKQDYAYFEDTKTGDLMTRLSSDVKQLQDLISPQSLKLISSLFTFIFIYIFMLLQDTTLTLLITITFPILYLLNVFFSSHIKAAYKKVRASTSTINNQMQNGLTSILLIKTFATEEKEVASFNQANQQNKKDYLEAMTYQTVFSPSIDFINYIGMAIVLIYLGNEIIKGNQTVGSLVAYLAYLRMLQNPIRSFTQMISRFQQSVVSYGRIIEIYESNPKITSPENAYSLDYFQQNIQFNDVSFNYNKDSAVLNQVDFTVKKGLVTALVGVSGSGKSTITKLLERLYDVSSGYISFDGNNIKDYSISSLRKNIGLVSQDIELIDGTIYENIIYGADNKKMTDIVNAVHAANLSDFVNSLPKGLETQIGERGIKLSGGQKQRIAIARIFLKNAPILILDEATASLDNESERYIQESLDRLMTNRTTLVIAHRLSTIQQADNIIVLEKGEIVEQGTHEELLANNSRYSDLYQAQFS